MMDETNDMVADQPLPVVRDAVERLRDQCERITNSNYIFGALALGIAAPVDLFCAVFGAWGAVGDVGDTPSASVTVMLWITLVFVPLSILAGLTALVVPHWLPISEGGRTARRVIRAVAIVALCSVPFGFLSVVVAGSSGS
jgi:hypothetical protein